MPVSVVVIFPCVFVSAVKEYTLGGFFGCANSVNLFCRFSIFIEIHCEFLGVRDAMLTDES